MEVNYKLKIKKEMVSLIEYQVKKTVDFRMQDGQIWAGKPQKEKRNLIANLMKKKLSEFAACCMLNTKFNNRDYDSDRGYDFIYDGLRCKVKFVGDPCNGISATPEACDKCDVFIGVTQNSKSLKPLEEFISWGVISSRKMKMLKTQETWGQQMHTAYVFETTPFQRFRDDAEMRQTLKDAIRKERT